MPSRWKAEKAGTGRSRDGQETRAEMATKKRSQQGLFEKQDELWEDAPAAKLVVEEVTAESEPKRARAGRAPKPAEATGGAMATKRGAARKSVAGKADGGKRSRKPSLAQDGELGESDAPAAALVVEPVEEVAAKTSRKQSEKPARKPRASAKTEREPGSEARQAEVRLVAEPDAKLDAALEEAEREVEAAAPWAGDEDEQAGERLQKLLARAGVASRRKAEELIAEGRVQVNGQVVTEPGTRAVLGRDHVRVDGKLIQAAERMRYFVLNKPKGYVTTVSDPEGRPTVMEFFRGVRERVYPVGRLDYLSEGLLVVTNDGPLANGLTRAAHGVEKRYLVKVAGEPTEAEIAALRGGVVIERGRPGSGEGRVRTAPAQIRKVREGENPWFEVVLIEGRNRELRKMFEEIGHHVEKIRRVGYGPLELDVEPGKLRELDEEELRLLRLAAEGKWKPKRRREPITLPKEAGRSVEHGRGGGGFAGRSTRPAGRTGAGRAAAGQRPGQRFGTKPGTRSGGGRTDGQERSWGERSRTESARTERPQWRDRSGAERDERGGGRSERGSSGERGQGFRESGLRREGGRPDGFTRPGKFAARPGGRPAGRAAERSGRDGERGAGFGAKSGSAGRPARRWEREGAERNFERGAARSGDERTGREGRESGQAGTGRAGAGRTGFARPGFAKPGEGKPGFGRSGAGRAGFGKSDGPRGAERGSGRWRSEEEKPQPGGRNSAPRLGADGKPRDKNRWRDSFEGKSKGKPKWAAKRTGKPKSK